MAKRCMDATKRVRAIATPEGDRDPKMLLSINLETWPNSWNLKHRDSPTKSSNLQEYHDTNNLPQPTRVFQTEGETFITKWCFGPLLLPFLKIKLAFTELQGISANLFILVKDRRDKLLIG
ncbi:hypothetical protein J6590_102228 [Homalodisca vitripennis]|nr:hypothetical protein J6590_102228 [Homalodisca vitripennis]